jgi:hypothetical protein
MFSAVEYQNNGDADCAKDDLFWPAQIEADKLKQEEQDAQRNYEPNDAGAEALSLEKCRHGVLLSISLQVS